MAIPLDAYDDPKPSGLTKKPGDFWRDSDGTPWVASLTKTRQPKGNKPELIEKVIARGIDLTDFDFDNYDGRPGSLTVSQLKEALGPEPALEQRSRPSSLGKQIENTYNLDKWSERQVALGCAVGELDLTALLPVDQDDPAWKSRADGIVVEAKRAAKANLAAERGTHTHLLAELDDEGHNWLTRAEHGEDLGLPTEVQGMLVDAWRRMLDDCGLEIVANEAPVVNDAWRAAGTLDRIAKLTKDLQFIAVNGEIVTLAAGTHLVLDIKTGKLTADDNGYPRYWHSYAIQIACYRDGVPYDPDTDTRGAWPFELDADWAIIAHLDVLAALDGDARCTPILVDLNAGRGAGNLCVAARDWQRRTDLFGHYKENEPCASGSTTNTNPVSPATSSATTSGTSTSRLSTSSPTTSSPGSPDDCSPTDSDSTLTSTPSIQRTESSPSSEETRRQALRERYQQLNDDQKAAFKALDVDSLDLDAIEDALNWVDPFCRVAPLAEPRPAAPAPEPVVHAARADLDALVAQIKASPVRDVVNAWIAEGNAAGAPWNPLRTPTETNYHRTRAALALAMACLSDRSAFDTSDREVTP